MIHPPRRILLIKPSSLGDIVHTLPVVAALHQSWPQTTIDWLVKEEWAPLLENHPMIHQVISLPRDWARWGQTVGVLRRMQYEMIIDLQGLLRSGLLTLMAGAPIRAGLTNGREGSPLCYNYRIALPDKPIHAVERYLHLVRELGVSTLMPITFPLPSYHGAENWVNALWQREKILPREIVCVVHPASRGLTRRWPAERYAELADRLITEKRFRVMLVGAQMDQIDSVKRLMRCHPVNLAGQTTLPQLVALLRRATVLITNVSGPMHLSAAVGTPVVAPLGPTDPRVMGPFGSGHIVLKKDVDCSSCKRNRCVNEMACLKSVGVADIYHSVEVQVKRQFNRRAARINDLMEARDN